MADLYASTFQVPNGTAGLPYAAILSATGGTQPYTYASPNGGFLGTVPPGLEINADGSLTGNPTKQGFFPFTYQVTDAAGATSEAVVEFTVSAGPVIGNTSVPAGIVDIPYAASLAATGGAAPYSFAVTAGALPNGLTLATNGGVFGTPTLAGNYKFTVTVTDAEEPPALGYATYTVAVAAASAIEADAVRSLDQAVLVGCGDGGLYLMVQGQRYDEAIDGSQLGILQQWTGIPTNGGVMGLNQLGGGTLGARGFGSINFSAFDDVGNITPFTSDKRPFVFAADDSGKPIETTRDFMARGVGKSARFGLSVDNGGVVGSWFELHVAILWMRMFYPGRKA